MAYDILKGGSTSVILVGPVILSSDHITGATGITLTVTISKNGAAFGSPAGAVTEISSGWYKIAGNATDSNTAGPIAVHATGTGCDPFDGVMVQVVDPTLAIYGANAVQINAVSTSPITTIKAVQGLAVDGVVTTLTNLPAITANWLTAAGINAAALNGKGDWSTVTPTNLTAAQIATGVWTDTTVGDFTTAVSVGKSLMNGVALGTGLTINAYTGNTVQTGDSYARIGAPVGASISADIAAVPTTVWAAVMTGTTTAIQAMRGFIAAMLGKSSGLDVGTPTYRNIADTKNVIASTADANGNRSAVTLDLT